MHFLANGNFPLDAVEAIRKLGHDVIWIRTDSPAAKDREILQRAVNEQRIVLTFDKDFGNLAFQFGLPANCGIVLFRLQSNSSQTLANVVANAIQTSTDWAGYFAVVEVGRIRMRPLTSTTG